MLSAIVLACYLACAAWLASSVYRAGDPAAHGRRVAGLALGVIALVLHAILLWRVLFDRPVLAFTIAETASLIGWPLGLIAIALSGLRPRFAGIGAVLTVVAGIVAATTVEGAGGHVLERPSWEIAAHIVLSTLAYALLTVEALESAAFQALAAGFAVLTLALFSGFVFVDNLFAQHLVHKTVLSCLAWVVFAVLLFGRWRFGWRGRTAANWALSGFALLGLAYFGSKIVLESILGRHWG